MIEIIAIIMAIGIGIAQFFSERFCKYCNTYYNTIISFSAGIAVTYIFLDLFPNFSQRAINLSEFLFLSLLIGFILFHIVEKHVYHHTKKAVIKKELGIENQIISVVYHVILGIVIFDFAYESIEKALLLFFPILIFTAVSTLPLNQHPLKKVNFFVSLSTFIGVIIAIVIFSEINEIILAALIGFVVGVLMFTIFRHSLPMGKEGKPLYFVVGVILYSSIVILIWLI